MGIRISHIKRSETQTSDTNQNASDSPKSSRSLINNLQHNDNATKVIPFEQVSSQIQTKQEQEQQKTQQQQQQQQEQQQQQQQQQQQHQQQQQQLQQAEQPQTSLPHSDYRSSSTVSTISSRTKPYLGSSPSAESQRFTVVRSHYRTQTFDRSRSRQLMTKNSNTRPRIQRPDSRHLRPPWRPSVIKSHFNHNKKESRPITMSPILSPIQCPRRQIKRTDGRRGCWSSLSCLSSFRGLECEAHLRRCSAARMAQANRPDVLDTSSVGQNIADLGNQEKSTGPTKFTPASRPRTFQPPFSHPVFRRRRSYHQTSCERAWERRHTSDRKSPDIVFDPLTTAISDSSTDIESIDPFSTVQDDTFPLRYVFYVEDNPRSLRIFGYCGRASQLARETHCRVDFQTQIPHKEATLVSMSDQTPICADNTQPVEPVLYHRGKRVRPVAVAAPSLNSLLRFVKQLDHNFPEFEASRFLSDRLDKTKFEISTESNQEMLA